MRVRLGFIAGAVALAMASAAYAVLEVPGEDHPAGSIGANFVVLAKDHVSAPSVIDAFIPTGSKSRRCLATLGESNFATAGTTMYCNARTVGGVDGIRINIYFPAEVPENVIVAITVYQQFAKKYGEPILYPGD